MEVPGGTLAPAAAASNSGSHRHTRIEKSFLTCNSRAIHFNSRPAYAPSGRESDAGNEFGQPLSGYWIFTAKMITADCPGVRVPTVALMVPAVPFAGAVIVPTVVLAAGLLLYTVKAGVASLTTTLVMLAVPAFVAVIR